MIFNNVDNVSESKYPLGLEGALMHVYENERNYCEMMKAVALSELRYYQDTGQDLFLNESGSFSNFLSRVKAFFKKALDESELKERLTGILYGNDGDKITLDHISIREQIQIITNSSSNIKAAQKMERETNKWIDDVVKELERMDKEFNSSNNNPYPKTSPDTINKAIELLRSIANDVTIICGLTIQSIKDANRQAKAICVKALTYKPKE